MKTRTDKFLKVIPTVFFTGIILLSILVLSDTFIKYFTGEVPWL